MALIACLFMPSALCSTSLCHFPHSAPLHVAQSPSSSPVFISSSPPLSQVKARTAQLRAAVRKESRAVGTTAAALSKPSPLEAVRSHVEGRTFRLSPQTHFLLCSLRRTPAPLLINRTPTLGGAHL